MQEKQDPVSSLPAATEAGLPSVAKPENRDQHLQQLLAKAEAAGLEPEDLDEMVHELAASIAADTNNSGMEDQLRYLIEHRGGQEVSKQLDRLVREKAPAATVESQSEIRGDCRSDDRVYSAKFNALPWFEQASDSEILELANQDWHDDYAADEIGMFMANLIPDVQKMFDYVEHYNQAHKEQIGWVCTVNKGDALAWLKEHRPQLHALFRKVEKY